MPKILGKIDSILIDIHGQHEFQSLTRAAAQRELLDEYGRLEPLAGQVGIAFRVWREMLERTLDDFEDAGGAAVHLVRFELAMLTELGFGLDLQNCAATGETDDLVYVSPKSGGAVSRLMVRQQGRFRRATLLIATRSSRLLPRTRSIAISRVHKSSWRSATTRHHLRAVR